MTYNAGFRNAVIIGLLVFSAATVCAADRASSRDNDVFLSTGTIGRASARVNQIGDVSLRATPISLPAAATSNTIYVPLIRSGSMCNDIEQTTNDPVGNDRALSAAQLLSVGRTCEGSLEDDAVGGDDYYWLDLRFGDELIVDLTGIAEGADYDLYLYRSDPLGQLPRIAFSRAVGQADEQISNTSTRTTRYFIRIHMQTKSTIALNTYALQVGIRLSTTAGCNDVEPNNTDTDAKQLTTVGSVCIGSFQERLPDGSDDASDTYWVDLDANQNVRVDVIDIQIGAFYDIRLYYGTELLARSNQMGASDQQIIITTSRAGRYYITVRAFQKTSTADNHYILGVSSFTFCDTFEPNDNRFANPAGPLIAGRLYTAKICAADSEDNYYFETMTGSQVRVRTFLPASLVANTAIAIYSIDALSVPLPGCYIDAMPLGDSFLECPIPSAGRFILRYYSDSVVDEQNPYILQVIYDSPY
ncbi:MAG TPA: hypothetical protein VFU22_06990 [Roseiflexaceae bacterium]|nr:hypothetical protein [Roseiflexaceae bacterium]